MLLRIVVKLLLLRGCHYLVAVVWILALRKLPFKLVVALHFRALCQLCNLVRSPMPMFDDGCSAIDNCALVVISAVDGKSAQNKEDLPSKSKSRACAVTISGERVKVGS